MIAMVWLLLLAIIFGIIYRTFRFAFFVDRNLINKAGRKKKSQEEVIRDFKNKYQGILSNTELSHIKSCRNIPDLQEMYLRRRLKVHDVVLYYCHAAIIAHERTNCLTEIMFEEALNQAIEMDLEFERTGKLRGQLHGVPISLKDTISFKGKDSTVGLMKMAFKPKQEHAPIVDQLIEAGGIPFVKTNVPQTMMTFECRNPLWGQTENPFKKGHIPGGSSGGEAALLASGGSIVGIGSDIGGSLRIPAHFSGCFSLKPSYNRISFIGSQCYIPATLLVHPVNGPMATNATDLSILSSVLMQPSERDIRLVTSAAIEERSKLKFGYALTDGFVTPVPAIQRAVEEAKQALIKAGHEVVEFKFPKNIADYISLYYSLMSADGGVHYLKALEGEPIDPILIPFFGVINMPSIVHRAFGWILNKVWKDKRFVALFEALGVKSVAELVCLQAKHIRYQQEFDNFWRASGIDVLICPPNAMPAPPYGSFSDLNFTASYTVLWNLLDYVAGVVPVTRVDSSKDEHEGKASGGILSNKALESKIQHFYDPKKMNGLPIGVQIVTPPYQEELALKAMKIVESSIYK